MGCGNSKENKKATTTQEPATILNQTPQAVGDIKPDAPAADGNAQGQAAPAAAALGVEYYEKMVGLWKTKEGEYTLEKDGDKLCYKESGNDPLTGTLVPVDSEQLEGAIYQGSELKGSLRIRIEGEGVRSYFKPSGQDAFDDVGFLATKVKLDTAEPTVVDDVAEAGPLSIPVDTAEETARPPSSGPELEEKKVGVLGWFSCQCTA